MTTEEIKDNNNIITWAQDRGAKLRRSGKSFVTNLCPKVEHKATHLCVSIEPDKQLWHCNDCDEGGSIIDWLMLEKNITLKEAIEELGGNTESTPPTTEPVKLYNYTDESGRLLYQVCRYEPKRFRQRRPVDDDWVWNLDGVTRVLYNLPAVIGSQIVCLTEGEKDAETLTALGFVATTACGGASSWLPAYASTLKNKDVLIFADNDKAGEEWYKKVITSLDGAVKSAKRVMVPSEHKDVSDWNPKAKELCALIDRTAHAIEPLPLYTIQEMEERYMDYVKQLPKRSFSMSRMCPSFSKISQRLMPGELVMVMGDTGQGKTAVLQAIAKSASPIPTLFFELELPIEAMFQRNVQMASGCYEEDVLRDYQSGEVTNKDRFKDLEHILTCDKSGITMDNIEKLITMSELKFGTHPSIVLIDYMGLVRKDFSKSRYEAMAYSAEQAKVIAKRTNTIVFIGSQVARPQGEDRSVKKTIGLHDAKGAGELENSANLIIGLTKPDDETIVMKVLKNTRGPVGGEIACDFNGRTMQIKERMIATDTVDYEQHT